MLNSQSWSAAPAAPAIRVDFPNDQRDPALRTPGHMGIWTCNRKISRSHLTDIPLAKEGEKFTRIKIVIKNSQEEIAKYNSLTNLNNTEMFHPVYIYFPVNGRQPTTLDAATWSCANIDNRKDSPITEWYMRMFGWTKSSEEIPLQIGFAWSARTSLLQSPKEIITLSDSFKTKQEDIKPKKSFWNIFRQIAANPVGRVLLYRLLIEIRRKNEHNIGCDESQSIDPSGINNPATDRNGARYIDINWGENSFTPHEHTIYLRTKKKSKLTTICEKASEENYRIIVLHKRPHDVGLFHEMLHWYHYLRNKRRYTDEGTARNASVKLNGFVKGTQDICIDIGRYYWDQNRNNNNDNDDLNDRWRTSARPWLAEYNLGYCIDFEEIRTILGSHITVKDYIEGDDLSENLYRSAQNCYMRFWHTDTPYYEDNDVINQAFQACKEYKKCYNGVKIQYIPLDKLNTIKKEDQPPLTYEQINEFGIGACKIRSNELKLIFPN